MTKLDRFDDRYPGYRPSILLVADEAGSASKLKQRLERTGLQIHRIDPSCEQVVQARQEYFEVMVLDLEGVDPQSQALCQEIKAEPELAAIPKVILTPCPLPPETLNRLDVGRSAYYLVKDHKAEGQLMRLIEQTHYLTDRYS